MKPELIKRTREHFNLNIYETKVWLALVSKSIATAGEIAELSGVPRSRTYDVLESLEKQGFAVEKLGKPVKYIAVSPSVVVERLKSNISREAEEQSAILEKIKETQDYKELELIFKQGVKPIRPEELSGLFKGKANIYTHIRNMLNRAEKEILIVTNSSDLLNKKFIKQLQELKRKGLSIKIALNGDAEVENIEKELKTNTKKVSINGRFCIVDGKEILFLITPESDDENKDLGVWINSPFFASALASMFNLSLK